jgi:hypothetical protein
MPLQADGDAIMFRWSSSILPILKVSKPQRQLARIRYVDPSPMADNAILPSSVEALQLDNQQNI